MLLRGPGDQRWRGGASWGRCEGDLGQRGLLSPPGSRAELYLLAFSVSTVDPFQDMLKEFLWGFLSFLLDFLTSGPGVRQGWSQKGCDHHPGYSTTEGFLIVWFWGSVAPSLHVVEQAGAQFFLPVPSSRKGRCC